MNRVPVTTLADLGAMDDAEIVEGYHAGREGWPEPGDNHSRAYWHGWRNGMIDSGRAQPHAASMALVKEYVARRILA